MDFNKIVAITPTQKVEVKRTRASNNGGVSTEFKAFLDTQVFNEQGQLVIHYKNLLPLLDDFHTNEMDKIKDDDKVKLNVNMRKMLGLSRYLNKNNDFKKCYSVSNTLYNKELTLDDTYKYGGTYYDSIVAVRK
jgi:hypothetical protein